VLSILLGGGRNGIVNGALNAAGGLETMNFSRAVESAADQKGAYTCAQAGYNPWGLVWLFQNFEKADTHGSMEMLSDHPTDQHRIDDLVRLFKNNPGTFGRYGSNIDNATPMPRRSAIEAQGPAAPIPGYQT
jgi:predicted Zn-dependent protease